MVFLTDYLFTLRGALLFFTPLLYAGAACFPNWRLARVCTALALFCAVASLVLLVFADSLVVHGPTLLAFGGANALALSVRADVLGCLVLLLVAFVGWVVTCYSHTYMKGQAAQTRYVRWLMATLAAVAVVVVANNLALLALAWLATSLALHQLLTFFHHRPAALIAAHKKFLASRLGDVCLFLGVAFIAMGLGTLEIDQLLAKAGKLPALPPAVYAAVCLIAVSALLKCAQLPMHGWLIQVMEAPTPVSALLHAGVVNLGGFLLIRLGPLVSEVGGAQTLLVVVGSVTATVAALVMLTRISVKVMLAWSTCAQMGFMLLQCGLGAYDLALLHLLAHSLCKAYAFLAAGGAVRQARLAAMSPPQTRASLRGAAAGAVMGLAATLAAGMVWGAALGLSPALWALATVVSLALAPLLTAHNASAGRWQWPLAGLAAFSVALVYFGWHHLLGLWIGAPKAGLSTSGFDVSWTLACFALLFALQSLIRARPHGQVASSLYPWFYAGLYADEWFTRITFKLWPAKLASRVTKTKTKTKTAPGAYK